MNTFFTANYFKEIYYIRILLNKKNFIYLFIFKNIYNIPSKLKIYKLPIYYYKIKYLLHSFYLQFKYKEQIFKLTKF